MANTGNLRHPIQTRSMTSAFTLDCERAVSYKAKNIAGRL